MKVLDYEPDYLEITTSPRRHPCVDLTLCTRCGHPWGFELVERIEMWSCDRCGYEVREKSVDFSRMQVAEQASILS
jgi:ribosomal protein L37AE/L43A